MAASGQDRIERRLAAILAADVAGYSRLTCVDEEGTHVQLQAHLRALIDPKVAEHRGRVVKNTGDGMLAEFSSVVDAVRCALDVQRGMAERNAGVQDEKRIEFRMGINVGDIIIDRGDIFGDGVNVAARLEGLGDLPRQLGRFARRSTSDSVELRQSSSWRDDVSRRSTQIQAERLVDELELSPSQRLDIKRSLSESRHVLTSATETVDIRRGSLVIDLLIDPDRLVEAVFVIGLWATRKVADWAWTQSPLRDRADRFFASIFRGARETAEHAMSRRRARSVVKPEQVVETSGPAGEPMLEVTILRLPLKRPEDWEHAAEMVRRLRDGP